MAKDSNDDKDKPNPHQRQLGGPHGPAQEPSRPRGGRHSQTTSCGRIILLAPAAFGSACLLLALAIRKLRHPKKGE